jgi:signal transduction histidine kinase
MSRPLLRKSQSSLIWLGVLPLLLAFVAYQISSQHVRSVEQTLSTADFIQKLDRLLSTVQDAETGQRGFILTGQASYLIPYTEATTALPARLSEVTASAPSHGIAPGTIAELNRAVQAKMTEMQHAVDLRRAAGFAAALSLVETNRGQQYMAEIRRLTGEMRNQQLATFRREFELQRRRQLQLEIVLGCGVLSGFIIVFIAYRFNLRYVEERDRIEREIRSLNEQLDARVKQRTAELEAQTKELQARTADLQRSNADLSQFAYVASHDLQEPLRMVASYMGLLSRRYDGQLDETGRKYVRFAAEGAARMQTLINDLLSYSRAGTQAIEKRRVGAEAVLKSALQNLEVAIRESGARIHSDPLPMIEADEARLVQVFQNLIANAIKFRKPDLRPEISVRAKNTGEEWIFEVADNGIGFDPRYTDRIFQVFQRLHGPVSTRGPGSGWPFAAASSSITADACGRNPSRAWDQGSSFRCRSCLNLQARTATRPLPALRKPRLLSVVSSASAQADWWPLCAIQIH